MNFEVNEDVAAVEEAADNLSRQSLIKEVNNMPRGDRTGPQGQGPRTGRGQGSGRGQGQGSGRGQGQGSGRGQGKGAGKGGQGRR